MVSRRLSAPVSCMSSRSVPMAKPPWRHAVAEGLQVGGKGFLGQAALGQCRQVVGVAMQALPAVTNSVPRKSRSKGIGIAGAASGPGACRRGAWPWDSPSRREVAAMLAQRPLAQPALVLRRQESGSPRVGAVQLQDQLRLGKVDVRDRRGGRAGASQFQFGGITPARLAKMCASTSRRLPP